MKRKVFSTLFALALVVGLSLVLAAPAGPVQAQGTPNPTFVTIDVGVSGMTIPADEIDIGWEDIGGSAQSGSDVIYVTTSGVTTPDLALVYVPTDFTLDGSTTASYWGYRISTENCTIRMPYESYWLLDTDTDSDVDTVLSNNYHPDADAGEWHQWIMADASARWHTVDLTTGVTSPAIDVTTYYGATVMGIALVAGSTTNEKVDAYLDNLVVNGETLLDEDTGTIEVLSGTINGTPWICSIQDGIDAAMTGDTVNVAADTFYENITLADGVNVQGAGAGSSIIDGGASGSVVTANSITTATTLDGFTITNGSGYDSGGLTYGGGMYIVSSSSSLTVSNCTLSGNEAYFGGGIYLNGSSPTVINCTLSGNEATGSTGGGMHNDMSSNPTVTGCTFSSNTANLYGGGMHNINSSSPTVINCIFYGNSAPYGGGMCNWSSSPTVTNCTFSGNSATSYYGSGMFNYYSSSPTVTNCILWDGDDEIYDDGTSSPMITYCDVYGGYSGTGNIDADPMLVNPAGGDYHLQSGSPCIDAGDNGAPSLPTTDFEGEPRIMNDIVDMGVDEYFMLPTEVWVNKDWTCQEDVNSFDPTLYWQYDAFASIQDGVDAVADSGTVYVHPGNYEEPAILIDKSLTLESVSGDWSDTIIDDYIDAEIVFAYDFAGVATIDGFTITGGMYGIYIDGLDGGTININNCFICDNGTGIYGFDDLDGDISINNCIITENHELETGIYLDNVIGTVEITDSVIGAYYDGETSYDGNSGDGIAIGSIETTGNVTIDNNKIVNNGSDGISIGGGYTVYGQLTITDNIIGAYDYDLASEENGYFTGNGGYGICVDYVEDTGIVNIDGNKIAENGVDGIEFGAGLAVEGTVTINDNIIGAWTQYDGMHSHQYTGNGHKGINVSFMVTSTGSMTITNNKIAENSGTVSNRTGIYIQSTYGDTTISGNYVGSWSETVLGEPVTYNGNAGPGIMIEHVPDGSLLIQENNVTGNTDRGIYVADNGTESGQVTIDGNTIDDNGTGGEGILLIDVNDATISGNTITRHIEDTMWLAGIWLSNSDNNTIINNTITDNWIGLYISSDSDGNRVEDNVISDNALDGIFIGGDSNEILFNNISNNLGAIGEHVACGIFLDSGAGGNVINFNNITDNTDTDSYGVYNSNRRGSVDARWNWWGAKSGPTHASNPGGTGDAISNNVSYDPWLGASVTGGVRQTVVDGPVDAMDKADTEVIVTGSATVTVANYSGNPGTSFGGDIGKYVDVHIDDPAGVTEIEIRVYYTIGEIAGLNEPDLRLLWWNGTGWVACSDSGVTYPAGEPTYRGYMWAKIRSDTTPNLAQLTGSVFGCQGAIAVGAGGDTTPPTISNVSQCHGGVTVTTADICWTTNEESTSQVKYWVTSSTLSPLDTAYVTEHHVQLTGLTPCTTYTYQTMSKDKSGNLTVSKEYTFTTLGEATFTSSDLSISPTEAGIGGTVTISVQVTNTSNCPGSYTVTLKINGVVEATSEVIIEAGASEEVTFTTTKDEAGTYSVDVDGLEGSFTVQEGMTPPPEEEGTPPSEEVTTSATNWALIGGIIGGVVIVGLIIFFLVRRRTARA